MRHRLSERALQKSVFDWLRLFAFPGVIAFHPANGIRSNPIAVKRMKAIGMMNGVADICLVLPGGRAAFLELKVPGNKQTESQLIFAQLCHASGAPYRVVDNLKDALKTLIEWGAIDANRLDSNTLIGLGA